MLLDTQLTRNNATPRLIEWILGKGLQDFWLECVYPRYPESVVLGQKRIYTHSTKMKAGYWDIKILNYIMSLLFERRRRRSGHVTALDRGWTKSPAPGPARVAADHLARLLLMHLFITGLERGRGRVREGGNRGVVFACSQSLLNTYAQEIQFMLGHPWQMLIKVLRVSKVQVAERFRLYRSALARFRDDSGNQKPNLAEGFAKIRIHDMIYKPCECGYKSEPQIDCSSYNCMMYLGGYK